jgi:SAM-dependent methyltransferase
MSHKLYDELVDLYPLVSRQEDYTHEARLIRDAVALGLADGSGKTGRPTLLDIGVGNGHVLSHLTPLFDAEAADLSAGMLAHSQSINPGVPHHLGDMRDLRIGKTFDAVLIHDAIHYMTTPDDLVKAMATAREHLRPGGAAVFMPCYIRETFINRDVSYGLTRTDPPEFTYVARAWDQDPTDFLYELKFCLFSRKGGELKVYEDRHTLACYPDALWRESVVKAGLIDVTPAGIAKSPAGALVTPIYVGRRRP